MYCNATTFKKMAVQLRKRMDIYDRFAELAFVSEGLKSVSWQVGIKRVSACENGGSKDTFYPRCLVVKKTRVKRKSKETAIEVE